MPSMVTLHDLSWAKSPAYACYCTHHAITTDRRKKAKRHVWLFLYCLAGFGSELG
ncbi:MAG: hypothetical protein N2B60_09105 [Psychrobacter sp.]